MLCPEPYKNRNRKAAAKPGTMTVQELEPYRKPMVRAGSHRTTSGKDREEKIFLFFLDIPMGADEDRANITVVFSAGESDGRLNAIKKERNRSPILAK